MNRSCKRCALKDIKTSSEECSPKKGVEKTPYLSLVCLKILKFLRHQIKNRLILVEGLDWPPYLNNLSPNRDQISVNTVCRKGDENNKRKILARIKMSVVLIMSINTMVKKFYFTNL